MPKENEVVCPITKQGCPNDCAFRNDFEFQQLRLKRTLKSPHISATMAAKQIQDQLERQAEHIRRITGLNRTQRQKAAISGNPALEPQFCFHQGDPLKKEP